MGPHRRLGIAFLLVVGSLLSGAALAPAWAQQAAAALLAAVNGQQLPKATYLARLEQRYGYETAESLVLEALILDAAAKANLTPTAAEIDAELARFRHEHFTDDARRFNEWLTRFGRAEAEVREEIRVQVAQFKLRTQGLSIDEAALQKYWQQHKDEYQRPEALLFRQIIIPSEPTSPKPNRRGEDGPSPESRLRAIEVLNKIKNGLKFEEAAAEYSEDPSAKRTGGLVGPTSVDLIQGRSATLAAALAQLQEGQMASQPVLAGARYVLVQLERRFAASKGDYQTLRTRVSLDYLAERMQPQDEFVAKLLKGANVQWREERFANLHVTGRWISPSGLSLPGWLRERR